MRSVDVQRTELRSRAILLRKHQLRPDGLGASLHTKKVLNVRSYLPNRKMALGIISNSRKRRRKCIANGFLWMNTNLPPKSPTSARTYRMHQGTAQSRARENRPSLQKSGNPPRYQNQRQTYARKQLNAHDLRRMRLESRCILPKYPNQDLKPNRR